MTHNKIVFENRLLRMEGSYAAPDLFIKSAVVREGLSRLTETTVEFLSNDRALKLETVVGYDMQVLIETQDKRLRRFPGTCVSAEYLGLYQGFGHFTAQLRPWLWMLTRNRDNRIFQDRSTPEIISDILADNGFSSNLKSRLSNAYPKREYCVQYGESDFDFLGRLMEEEGIYYYFVADDARQIMVLADGLGGHDPIEGGSKVAFQFREANYRRDDDHVFEWAAIEYVTSGKVSMTDYNFETPTAALRARKSRPSGKHQHRDQEIYRYPGHYRDLGRGTDLAGVRMEAEAARHRRWSGAGNLRTLAVGATFTLDGHPRVDDDSQFLVTEATHYLQVETDYEDADTTEMTILGNRLAFDASNRDAYRCVFGVMSRDTQFRAPQTTPWPAIPGMQTAVVTGPPGKEIHTDKHGRIKVQFHWDRKGEGNDNSSCWVRTVMPWSGRGWGMVALPRVGQEVVIQFEEGDPDRPVCTGMLYNAATMPPFTLPDNMTQSGIRTNSSEGGGGFHELMFEDKKDEELVRFQSEKDFQQIVKNNAEISIGVEKQDGGDLTQTIHRHKTETLKTGNMSFTVEAGDESRSISGKQAEDVGGNRETEIGGSDSLEIGAGRDTSVATSDRLETGTGITHKAGTTIDLEAAAKITLKVGGSTIELTPAGVTIKAPMIQIDGSGMTEVKGGGALILKGGMTLIN